MKKEINAILPKLKTKIGSMNLTPEELPIYEAMIARLEAGSQVDWTKFQPIHAAALNKGGFVLRDRGTLRGELPYGLLPDAEKTIGTGSFGAAVLHDQSATAGNAPTHTSGKHEGFRKSAGYSFMGGQSYNLLTESNDSITSPYPFTFEDAVESEKTLIDDLNAAQDEVEKLEKSKVGKSEKQIKQ